jgi:hypothetical protein
MDLIDGERRNVPPSNVIDGSPSPRMRRVLEKARNLSCAIPRTNPPSDAHRFGDVSTPFRLHDVRAGAQRPKNHRRLLHPQLFAERLHQNDLETLQALGDHCGGALERIRAEAENQKLAAFPQFNPNPVLELAADGSINYFNEAAQQMALSLGRQHPL